MKWAPVALLTTAMVAVTVFAGHASNATAPHIYTAHYENVLGTSFEMKALVPNEQVSAKAEAAALAEVDREAKILSSWDSGSEFSKWFQTRDKAVHVSPDLFQVFALFDEWRTSTRGALDPGAEAITRVWQRAAVEKQMPTGSELSAAVTSVRERPWVLNVAKQTATHTSDTPLAMNSLVKSYIIGRAVDAAMKVAGVRGVVVNIGGDLVVRGDWNETVNITDPRSDAENAPPLDRVSVRDRAVATSGDYRRGVEINGRHYSHIVDPRTGEPAEEVISSTVIAPVPATAGALATAFSVMMPEQSAQLAASIPDVDYMLVERDGTIVRSNGWNALEAHGGAAILAQAANNPKLELVSAPAKADWDPEYALTIGVQLPFMQFRARRPYLAVWIVDAQNKRPVKTLALWYDDYKTKYLDELSEWFATVYASNRRAGLQPFYSVSSATRPPGTYTFEWDGQDQSGNLVKPGKYIVHIEAAREHGTHQLIKQEMDFNGTPQKVNLRGGIEIASAYLDYHKTTR